MQRLAKETGGGYFAVSKKRPIDDVYSQIQEELRNQYSLGYAPQKGEVAGEYRKIKLTVKDKTQIVQTRDGYYAER
jgi:VWFA-related protein